MQPTTTMDVIDVKEGVVSKDEFTINKYTFAPVPFEDLVHSKAPYVHYQILRPKDDEQREKVIANFNEKKKLFITSMNRNEILLYLGCTNDIYIRSTMADVKEEELSTLLRQAWQWFCLYGKEVTSYDPRNNR